MPDFSSPKTLLPLAAVIAIAVPVAFYIAGPSSLEKAPQAPKTSADTPSAVERAAAIKPPERTWATPSSRQPGAETLEVTAEAGEVREMMEMRRASRFERYSQIPVEERAQVVADRWELTPEQKAELEAILSRYSAELAALGDAGLSDAELARAQNQLQARQMDEVTPIIAQSPRMVRSKQKFMDAARARGGQLVTDK